MPKIRYVAITCPRCGAGYKVRLERVEAGAAFECVTCGGDVDVRAHLDVLKLLYEYSAKVIEIEQGYRVEGDTVVPLAPEPSRKVVSW